MGGWVDVLQVFQVHPDLCLGILQLYAGGAGGGQAQGSNQAFNSFKISYQVGDLSNMKYALHAIKYLLYGMFLFHLQPYIPSFEFHKEFWQNKDLTT